MDDSAPQPAEHQRRWKDLRLSKLAMGLCLAPILPMLVSMLPIWLFVYEGEPAPVGRALLYIGYYMAIVVFWSLASGLAAVWIVARGRGLIGRTTCLLLGCTGAFLLPIFAAFVGGLIKQLRGLPLSLDVEDLQVFCLLGFAALPFGLVGGWLFWRIGVRPAVRKTVDIASAFD
jgi:hypothetical protein